MNRVTMHKITVATPAIKYKLLIPNESARGPAIASPRGVAAAPIAPSKEKTLPCISFATTFCIIASTGALANVNPVPIIKQAQTPSMKRLIEVKAENNYGYSGCSYSAENGYHALFKAAPGSQYQAAGYNPDTESRFEPAEFENIAFKVSRYHYRKQCERWYKKQVQQH